MGLLVETKTSGEPRIVRESVDFLRTLAERSGLASCAIFGAPFIHSKSRLICKDAGVGFVDLSGNCRIVFESVFIERFGQPNTHVERRPLRTLFAPKASRVARKLLSYPKKDWEPLELAHAANVSPALVSRLKKRLTDLEYLCSDVPGIKLREPERLLKDWAKVYSYQDNPRLECYAGDKLPEIERQLSQFCNQENIAYGVTMFAAADRIEPFVRGYPRIHCYVDAELKQTAKALGWKEVSSGGNIILMQPFDQGVLFDLQEVDSIKLVSNIQLYLDLNSNKARGEEAAEALLERRLEPNW